MERLTQINGNNEIYCIVDNKKIVVENIDMLKICQCLKLYEDLDEQGLLLRLPLKIGDTVYSVTKDFISEYWISSITVNNEGFYFCWRCKKGIYINLRGFTEYNIGKTVFLTKAEAEQKLKEMENK